MSTFNRAIGDADEPEPEMFGRAIPSLRKVKNLNDDLMDLISHAIQLSDGFFMERVERVVFKLFTLWRATGAMSIETRTKVLQDAQSHCFKDDSQFDPVPKFKSPVARIAYDVLEEMIKVVTRRTGNDFTYKDIERNF